MSLEDVSLRVAYQQLNFMDFAMSLEDERLRVASRQLYFIDFAVSVESGGREPACGLPAAQLCA
jgi:hypothetical protein